MLKTLGLLGVCADSGPGCLVFCLICGLVMLTLTSLGTVLVTLTCVCRRQARHGDEKRRGSAFINQGNSYHGDRNNGDRNHGDRNHGDRNHGDMNHGARKNGDINHRDRKCPDSNHEDRNHGDIYHGDRNQGSRTHGERNNEGCHGDLNHVDRTT